MNNKGFAITTVLYGIMILFLMLLLSMLGILTTYKGRLDKLIDGNNGARDIINGMKWVYSAPGVYELKTNKTGTYRLEVWGAQGGTGVSQGVLKLESLPGGYGSYSVGEIYLNKNTILYIVVGGKGENANGTPAGFRKPVPGAKGGFNGGGDGGNDLSNTSCNSNYDESNYDCDTIETGGSEPGAGGGGATHISFVSGELYTLKDNKDSILIVAGGGGGAADLSPGSSSTDSLCSDCLSATFGVGTKGQDAYGGCGGGGAGYVSGKGGYGTVLGDHDIPNGSIPGYGGTGYVGHTNLKNKFMYYYDKSNNGCDGYNCKTNNISRSDLISKCVKEGNGAARITFLSE